MARAVNRLTVRQVDALKKPGRHPDGGGLYLRITPNGARAWVFMTAVGGKRVEIGLGGASLVSLAAARRTAEKMREVVASGGDPRNVIARQETVAVPTTPKVPLFGAWADTFIEGIESGFKNAVHRQQWRTTLTTHAALLREMQVDAIATDDVLTVLRPIWATKNETAARLRGRIERILDAARARGHIASPWENPARWRGHLEHFLPQRPKKSLRRHHATVPWREMPEFMEILRRRRQSASVLALQFTILTAARTGEVIGAHAAEFDLSRGVWTVPPERMKMSVEHQVALSRGAIDLLRKTGIEKLKPNDRVFPLSNMAMLMLMKDELKRSETVHGTARSSFRDWAGEATEYPRDLAEMALAHAVGDATEAAYRRGRALEKRRALMRDWSSYLGYDETVAAGAAAEIDPPTPTGDPPAPPPSRNRKGRREEHPAQTGLFE